MKGLTCNGIEWVASFGGGSIVEPDGKISINNPQAAAALNAAKGWIGTITPEGALNYAEEEARGIFQSGNAVFMRNWPYAWGLANAGDSPVKDKVGVAVLPQGEGEGARHAAALGGQQLAVSKYSANPKEAADLVRYLTSAAEQKRRALAGFNPTRKSLYSDAELLQSNPVPQGIPDGAWRTPRRGPRRSRAPSTIRSPASSCAPSTTRCRARARQRRTWPRLEKSLDRVSRGGRW